MTCLRGVSVIDLSRLTRERRKSGVWPEQETLLLEREATRKDVRLQPSPSAAGFRGKKSYVSVTTAAKQRQNNDQTTGYGSQGQRSKVTLSSALSFLAVDFPALPQSL